LSMTCGSREESALIVNEMVDLFLSLQGSTKKEEVATRLARLEDQRVRVQRDLDAAERSLDDVRKRWGFTDLDEHNWQDTITLKLKDLETQQSDLIMQIKQIQTNIEVLRRQATGPINEQVEELVETDPTMVMLTQQIAYQESQLAGLLAKFGENHKVVRQTQEFIAETKLKRQMRQNEIAEQTRRANLANGIDQLVVLQARLEELEKLRLATEAKNRDLDLARTQYKQRVAIRDERRDMLDSVKSQLEKLKILHDDPETVKVQSMGYAPEPLEKSFPKIVVFLPAGIMLGLMSGIGLAFLIEILNDMVRTPKDVARYLRIPLLGVIPETADDPMIEDHDIDLCHIVRQVPYSVSGEAYRQFRTNLRLSSNGALKKVLLISSCNAGEGKTPVAANLAATLVSENKKVLVIDANLWQPGLHKVFPRPSMDGQLAPNSELGLNHLLKGQCEANDVIRQCDVEGLYVLDAGRLSSKPAHLLANQRMEEFLKQQRDNYDYIIIDGLPVLLVSESKVLAKLVDGTIMVFNAATTRRGAAQRAIRELKDVNADILGCVIFGARILKGGYFREQFKSYQEYHKPLLVNPT
jgi:succinoglycan biosynthesis transport protein ExoP